MAFFAVSVAVCAPACTDYKIVPADAGRGAGGSTGNVVVGTGGSGGPGGAAGSGVDGGGGSDGGGDAADSGAAGMSGGGGASGSGGMLPPPQPAMLVVNPSSKDLSVVVIGRYADATFEVSNSGGVATSLPVVGLDGTDAAQYMITTNACSAGILPAKSCLVTVRFTPTSAGLKTARLNVQATLGGAVTATLQGSGVSPGALTVDPANQSVGSVLQGQRGAPVTFTVTNTGGEASGALATTISDSTELAITTDGCRGVTLAPAGKCTIVVTFGPTSPGQKSATLSVTASPGGTASAGLTGVGIAPAALSASPTTATFPATVTGATSAPISFTITNSGGASAGTTTAVASLLAGTNATEFAIATNGCGATLAAGATCAMGVTFKPISAGGKAATLNVSAAPGGAVSVSLTGTARTPAALALDPATGSMLDFGSVATGASVSQTFVATNTGQDTSTALAIAASGTDFTISAPGAGDCVPGTTALAAGASCTIHVKFAPITIGAKTATLSVSASVGGMVSRTLTGTGILPGTLTIAPLAPSFGSVQQGASGTPIVFTVSNTGGTTTGALATAISGSTEFSISADGCRTKTLVAAATCTISVTFAPGSPGQKTGSLTVTASPGGTATANLAGVGLAPALLAIAPTSLNFPTGTVSGTISAAQSLTVTNTGGVASGMPVATLSGTDAGQFVIASNGCTTALAAGASCAIGITFRPTSAGAKSATLSVSATPGGTVSATIGGAALSPAAIHLDPASGSSVDFASVLIGANSLQTFVVSNTGQQASSAVTVSVTGADFVAVAPVTGDCTSGVTTLAPSATCTVRVRFTPGAAGTRSGTVAVSASTGGSTSLSLSGIGVTPSALAITPLTQSFTPVPPNMTSGSHTFTVTNSGGAATAALTTGITGTTEFSISADGCRTRTLASAATCTITVVMTPVSPGAKSGTLTVGGGAGVTASATLTGAGQAPALLSITPTTFAFPATPVATTSATKSFTVTNTGDVAAGTGGGLATTLSGANAGDFVISSSTCSGTLPGGGGSCQVVLGFSPTLAGNRGGTLGVSATPGGTVTASLSGTGLRRLGDACSVGTDCPNGFCVDNHCCGTASCGQCRSCNGPAGVCGLVTNTSDPGTCDGVQRCDAAGTCANQFTEFSTGGAGLISPFEMTVGPPGDRSLYVTDTSSAHIFRVTLQGAISPVTMAPALTSPTQSIGIGPDNQIWFTETGPSVDRLTAGTLTRFPTAHPVGGQTIVSGPDGNVWFTEYGSGFIGRVTPSTGAVSEFPIPVGTNPYGLAFAADGNLWVTIRGTPDQVVRMTPSGGNIINPLPVALSGRSLPGEIARGPGGNLWFSEFGANRISFVTPLGSLSAGAVVLSAGSGVTGVTYDAGRNLLWFAEFLSGRLGRVTLSGTSVVAVDEFPAPLPSDGAQSPVVDPDGNIWFVEQIAQKIVRFIP